MVRIDSLGLDGGIDDCGFGVSCKEMEKKRKREKEWCKCFETSLIYGPLTEKDLEFMRKVHSRVDTTVAVAAGMLTAFVTRGANWIVGGASGGAVAVLFGEVELARYQEPPKVGDYIRITTTRCNDKDSDLGYRVNVEAEVIRN